MTHNRLTVLAPSAAAVLFALLALVPGAPAGDGADPLSMALESADAEVRTFNDHLTTLASPWMEGRVPGSRGMELASEYVEHYFREYGLKPPFSRNEKAEGGQDIVTPYASYRQPFELSGTLEITKQSLILDANGRSETFEAGTDFEVTGMGGPGDLTAPLVFVGYSIDEGPDGYASYPEGTDLDGKIALMLRFEPMDEQGKSRWAQQGPWSDRASFMNKIQAARDRKAAAIIVINTPGADDPRAKTLKSIRGGSQGEGCPVVGMTAEAAERLVHFADPQGRSLMDLRRLADAGGGTVIDLNQGAVWLRADMERKPLIAENVGGLLPGRGPLAEEYIVIGAHLDHLGMGYFGSRSGSGTLHPGADDNASGSAGILLLAQKLVASYAALPADANLRSVLFIAFSAEESGLHGSRHYVDYPIAPLEQHVLMINFDMIGRIVNERLRVAGMNSSPDFEAFLAPIFEACPLEEVPSEGSPGGSDHMSFERRRIPVLFGIIADFHGDYHTPEDVSWKINRVGAVKAVQLFHDIALAAAQRPQRFAYKSEGGGEREPGPRLADIKVRFGIVPGSYDEDERGIAVRDVTEGGSAQAAGILAGDVMVSWNKTEIEGIRHWMGLLASHQPGDTVEVGVIRDGKPVTVIATLQAKTTGG